jgi:hypothetical protein
MKEMKKVIVYTTLGLMAGLTLPACHKYTGISADGGEISITLNDTVVGLYVLNQTSASLAVYANLDSVGSYAWSTNQGSDTAQAGGTVDVTAINAVNRTISGIFSFKAYRNSDGSQKDITAGVFYNIPYVGP